MFNWSQACTAQFKRPLSQLQQANYGSGIFAVSVSVLLQLLLRARSLPPPPPLMHPVVRYRVLPHNLQVASFGCAAAFGGIWLVVWVRMIRRRLEVGVNRRRDDRTWPLLGWFSGLVCAGSVAGAIAWGATMPNNAFNYESSSPGFTHQQSYALQASSSRWLAVFLIFYPMEFLFLIMAKLMLLGRLSNHAYQNYSQAQHMHGRVCACDCIGEYALEKLHRVLSAAAVVGSVVGMLALFIASAYNVKTAEMLDQAAAACDVKGHSTNSSNALLHDAGNLISIAGTAASVQNFVEAAVLVVMSAAYIVFIPLCVAIVGRAERSLISFIGHIEYKQDHTTVFLPPEYNAQAAGGAAAGQKIQMRCDKGKDVLGMTLAEATAQRRRIVAACAIVLITFFLRASFDMLIAYSNFRDQKSSLCGSCDPCQSDAFLIAVWLNYTPEFQAIVVVLSSPLPLVVSLWLMMTKEDRMLLLSPKANGNTALLLPEQRVVTARRNMAIDFAL